MSLGNLFGITFYFIAVIILLYSLFDYFTKRKTLNLIFFTLIIITLIYWGQELRDILCEGCKNSG